MTKPLTIAIVSDVICPWCYLGKRRLERAAEIRSYRGAGISAAEEAELDAAEENERQKRRKVDDARRAEYLIRDAMAQGKFDNLKYAGKPIPGLGEAYDPDWWVKGLLQRENVTGLGPKAILLRTEDAGLDGEALLEEALVATRASAMFVFRIGERVPLVTTPTRWRPT